MNYVKRGLPLAGLLWLSVSSGCGAVEPAVDEVDAPSEEALVTRRDGADSGARFGTMCQQSFQNNWRNKLPYTWNRCGWFNDELNDTDTQVFYYNLVNAKNAWEGPADQLYLDNVNLFFASTHGGAWSDTATHTMWNNNSRAFTSQMRLGNESYGLSILSTYVCETLKHSDGKLITRWHKVMKGGLRFVTSSHDKFYAGITTDEIGEDYADELQHKTSIRYAWKDAVSDWYVDNDASVLATGTNKANCISRRNGMKWQNYPSYSRLRDGAIGYYCITYWSNL